MFVVQIVLPGLAGLALFGWGALIVLRGEAPTIKAGNRAWRSSGEAGIFCGLLGAAMLVVAFMWIAAATGFAGPDGTVSADAGFFVSFIPTLLCILAVTRYRPRKVNELCSH
jgi:apolipoprotein N-acyltransferase